MAAAEESPLNPAWSLKNLISRSAKVFLPRLSVVACRQTRVATTAQNQVEIARKMNSLHASDEAVMRSDGIDDEAMIATTELLRMSHASRMTLETLDHHPCLRSLPSQCLPDSNFLQCLTVCLLSLLAFRTSLLLRRHSSLLRQAIGLECPDAIVYIT